MNSNPIPFNFESNPVRAIDKVGEIWFVAADVCAALGHDHQASALRRLDDDEKGVHTMHTPGGAQGMTIISEPGLYRLTMTSRKESAKRFTRWVTHEVLPSIRKTGQFKAAPAVKSLTPAQQRHIQHAVSAIAYLPGNSFKAVYRSIKDKFAVGSYKDVPATRYPELCRYLGTQPLEGDLFDPEQPEPAMALPDFTAPEKPHFQLARSAIGEIMQECEPGSPVFERLAYADRTMVQLWSVIDSAMFGVKSVESQLRTISLQGRLR